MDNMQYRHDDKGPREGQPRRSFDPTRPPKDSPPSQSSDSSNQQKTHREKIGETLIGPESQEESLEEKKTKKLEEMFYKIRNSHVDQFEKHLRQFYQKIDDKKKERDRIEEQLTPAKSDLQKLEEEHKNLSAILESTYEHPSNQSDTLSEHISQKEAIQSKLEKQREDVAIISREEGTLENQFSIKKTELQALQQKEKELKKQREAKGTELQTLQQAEGDLNKELQSIKALQVISETRIEKAKELKKQREAKGTELQALQKEEEKELKKQIGEIRVREIIEKELQTLQTEIEKRNADRIRLSVSKEGLDDKINLLKRIVKHIQELQQSSDGDVYGSKATILKWFEIKSSSASINKLIDTLHESDTLHKAMLQVEGNIKYLTGSIRVSNQRIRQYLKASKPISDAYGLIEDLNIADQSRLKELRGITKETITDESYKDTSERLNTLHSENDAKRIEVRGLIEALNNDTGEKCEQQAKDIISLSYKQIVMEEKSIAIKAPLLDYQQKKLRQLHDQLPLQVDLSDAQEIGKIFDSKIVQRSDLEAERDKVLDATIADAKSKGNTIDALAKEISASEKEREAAIQSKENIQKKESEIEEKLKAIDEKKQKVTNDKKEIEKKINNYKKQCKVQGVGDILKALEGRLSTEVSKEENTIKQIESKRREIHAKEVIIQQLREKIANSDALLGEKQNDIHALQRQRNKKNEALKTLQKRIGVIEAEYVKTSEALDTLRKEQQEQVSQEKKNATYRIQEIESELQPLDERVKKLENEKREIIAQLETATREANKLVRAKRETQNFSFSDWMNTDQAKKIASRLSEEQGPAGEATRRRNLPTEGT